MTEKIKKYKLSIIWAIIMMIGCTYHFTEDTTPKLQIPYLDKIIHFGIFEILSFLIMFEKKVFNQTKIIKTMIICGLYGGIIEIIQKFLPYRGCELNDLIADIIGTIAGIFILKILIKKKFFGIKQQEFFQFYADDDHRQIL
ncbi:MAG: VanZ family protein [Bacteroidales bacterium]|nr:VanZ family protein [Bacteroidales bacterium]